MYLSKFDDEYFSLHDRLIYLYKRKREKVIEHQKYIDCVDSHIADITSRIKEEELKA